MQKLNQNLKKIYKEESLVYQEQRYLKALETFKNFILSIMILAFTLLQVEQK
ncbi:hypothetical protein [Campylobacter jejuni]|uniref:hypothetical protein n=1 Tax=Campylobacter jejuni TaxID=197 RepID=UPI00192DF26F|nr:hypothetical protein [Campylobacter jejuni]